MWKINFSHQIIRLFELKKKKTTKSQRFAVVGYCKKYV